ncbi:membrane-bound lytic murein transglycosylase D [Malonomonas rubra DSM 5091]|uniref:Membrane-bound lytic murein transglycosylase D n=1 Tax=Malonomonas rubra DSM 5091 TaxID=1122189 RepID=A0A1M6C5Q5_MALRU|nr:LysM peptidoglycan-binding domain-containing protein [Malonomonas rubra]SHI56292.1 membrane-bound lytic murein transglycosylase D [Malonomonas rubra DSM 5091]
MLRFFLVTLLLFGLGGCFTPAPKQVDILPGAAPETAQTEESVTGEITPAQVDAAVEEAVEVLNQQPLVLPIEPPAVVIEETIDIPVLPYWGDFPLSDHPRVDKLYKLYTGNARKTFGNWLKRAGLYIPMIQKVFEEEEVPLDLAYLAMIESGFNVRAYSWAHAAGPWQFIESTAKLYDMKNDWWQDQRCDIEKATHAAAQHLKYLHQRFDGDWYLAVAAYNAGGGKVRKAIRKKGSRDYWDLVDGKVLREETKNYIPKLIAALKVVKDLDAAGFGDLEVHEPIEYETVSIPSSTDLDVVARFCDVDYATIKALNPQLKRWSTPPGCKNYQLKVPAGTAEQFNLLYAELPKDQRARYHRHQIKSGDTLGKLARTYRIQIDDIITLNNIENPRALKIGQNLILPLQENFTSLPVDSLADNYQRSYRKTYTVRSGDSLWKIAKRFGVSEKELRVWNRLGWSNMLKPGQKLAVSKPRGRTKVASRKVGPAKKVVYSVRPGDSLWKIGRQFDVELDMIRLWNDLSHGQVLRPGQKLTLMVPTSGQG